MPKPHSKKVSPKHVFDVTLDKLPPSPEERKRQQSRPARFYLFEDDEDDYEGDLEAVDVFMSEHEHLGDKD